jgi:hypothetical protein
MSERPGFIDLEVSEKTSPDPCGSWLASDGVASVKREGD